MLTNLGVWGVWEKESQVRGEGAVGGRLSMMGLRASGGYEESLSVAESVIGCLCETVTLMWEVLGRRDVDKAVAGQGSWALTCLGWWSMLGRDLQWEGLEVADGGLCLLGDRARGGMGGGNVSSDLGERRTLLKDEVLCREVDKEGVGRRLERQTRLGNLVGRALVELKARDVGWGLARGSYWGLCRWRLSSPTQSCRLGEGGGGRKVTGLEHMSGSDES